MSNVAIVLSGCGYLDGSEIHETTLLFLALAEAGHKYTCFAPEIDIHVVDHLTGNMTEEKRNALVEAARIARGAVFPLDTLNPTEFDALVLPGGFGAASVLSNFAKKGADCTLLPALEKAIIAFHEAKKPILATCIAPVLLGKALKGPLTMTLGVAPEHIRTLEDLGCTPVLATVDEVVSDKKNHIYTTPCYMEPPDLAGMYRGIQNLVDKL